METRKRSAAKSSSTTSAAAAASASAKTTSVSAATSNKAPITSSSTPSPASTVRCWSCSKCTYSSNVPSAKKCTMCSAERPPPPPLTIRLTCTLLPGAKPHLLNDYKPSTTLGFLSDIIEAKYHIPDRKQRIYHKQTLVVGSADSKLVDMLDFDPRDVLALTIEHADGDVPLKGNALLKKTSSSKQQATSSMEEKDHDATAQWDMMDDADVAGQQDDAWNDGETNWDDDAANIVTNDHMHDVASKTYRLLDRDQLWQQMMLHCHDTADTLGLSLDDALALHHAFHYDAQHILDEWMKSESEARKQAGLPQEHDAPIPVKDNTFSCPVCSEDVEVQNTYCIHGGHRFCVDCWHNWVTAEFEHGPTAVTTKCAEFKCPLRIPFMKLLELMNNHVNQSKLKGYLMDDFCLHNPGRFQFCPLSDCNHACEKLKSDTLLHAVDCACQRSWCFECRHENHRPANCEDAKQWLLKCSSDGENAKWVIANTKSCPACGQHIEKNQGCNHMTCKCKHEFCWLCKADWKSHAQCGSYKEDVQKELDDSAKAQSELNKYLHYFTRFDNHSKSIKFAENTRKKAEDRMSKLQDLRGSGLREVSFLLDAVDGVIRCKRILQWSYCHGFFLKAAKTSSQRLLFESHQQRLEEFADLLHGLAEKPLNELCQNQQLRVDIISLTRTVEKYRKNVVDAIEKGFITDE